jgi:hypothetical protein
MPARKRSLQDDTVLGRKGKGKLRDAVWVSIQLLLIHTNFNARLRADTDYGRYGWMRQGTSSRARHSISATWD